MCSSALMKEAAWRVCSRWSSLLARRWPVRSAAVEAATSSCPSRMAAVALCTLEACSLMAASLAVASLLEV